MEIIEKIQYQVASAITRTWRGISLNKLYEEFRWESLSGGLGVSFNFRKYVII